MTMKILVIYDSVFGNTKAIAQAIGETLGSFGEALMVHVKDAKPGQLTGLSLLVVGSPTRAFRPTKDITGFLKKIPIGSLNGVKVAAFDTRLSATEMDSGPIKTFVKLFGYAAKPIADRLVKKGGVLAAPPEGFFVADTEGPLTGGEIERANKWAKTIAKAK